MIVGKARIDKRLLSSSEISVVKNAIVTTHSGGATFFHRNGCGFSLAEENYRNLLYILCGEGLLNEHDMSKT